MLHCKFLLRYSFSSHLRNICTKPLFINKLNYSNRIPTIALGQPKFTSRCLHTEDNGKISNDELECIYRFSHIGIIYFASRLKVYFLPVMSITFLCDLLELEEIISTSYASMLYLGSTMLGLNAVLLGLIVYRWIGIIYTNHDKSLVRISYMDAMGSRVDEDFTPNDFIPVDTKKRLRDRLFVTIKTHKKKKFKINFMAVESADYEKLESILGDIPISAFPS